ncbi:hypothetical protein [Terrabacter sp. NPDC080008]|uniref:hypothetical protein n=1 Tax=Terrabacter sp. NPDC080008 TaxID=3155176 RepID=UPI00344B1E2E
MSRSPEAGNPAAVIPGEVALPRPSGDAQSLRRAAGSLDRAAARAGATATVQGTLAARLGAVWTGAAATAARCEAANWGVVPDWWWTGS